MKKILLLAALAALSAAACAPTQPQEPEVDRVGVLEARVNELINDMRQMRQAINSNADAMDQIRDEIVEELRNISADSARISVKFDSIENELAAMTERLDDTEYRISDMRKEISNMRINRTGTEYTRPTGTPERQFSATGGEDADETGQMVDTGEQPLPANQQEAYEIAYNDFLRGDYALAANGFRDYLAAYPQGNKREDARFNLAEALFNQGVFEGALEEYDTFILNYPNSPRAINARYKKALSFLESNQTPSGVILLRQIISQYPDSNEARLASEKLRSLGLNP